MLEPTRVEANYNALPAPPPRIPLPLAGGGVIFGMETGVRDVNWYLGLKSVSGWKFKVKLKLAPTIFESRSKWRDAGKGRALDDDLQLK